MVNWKNIKNKYPKSFSLLKKYYNLYEVNDGFNELSLCTIYSNYLGDNKVKIRIKDRELYSFFDSYNIFINIIKKNIDINYKYKIIYNNEKYSSNYIFKDRENTETVAFILSFEILEKELNEFR